MEGLVVPSIYLLTEAQGSRVPLQPLGYAVGPVAVLQAAVTRVLEETVVRIQERAPPTKVVCARVASALSVSRSSGVPQADVEWL